MPPRADPEIELDCLPNADGSASYSYGGYSVIASVNGPMEAMKRDETAFAADVEVIVRPASGYASSRERELEELMSTLLKKLILVNDFPRQVFHVVLQYTAVPEDPYSHVRFTEPVLNLSLIPPLVQVSMLALISALVPMATTAASAVVAVMAPPEDHRKKSWTNLQKGQTVKGNEDGGSSIIVVDPTPQQVEQAASLHFFAFSRKGILLANRSHAVTDHHSKAFKFEDMRRAADAVRRICVPPTHTGKREKDDVEEDEQQNGDAALNFASILRDQAEAKADSDLHWRAY